MSMAAVSRLGLRRALQSTGRRTFTSSKAALGEAKHTLVLIRHGRSEWNDANRFTGWYDVALSPAGEKEAVEAGKLLKQGNFKFDLAYTSYLRRAIKTCWHALEQTDQMHLPVVPAWQLNERHYGGLTGLDKQETVAKHGKEQVLVWRRSYDIPPPALDTSSEHYPGNDDKYAALPRDKLPRTESLATTLERVLPYWEAEIAPRIRAGERVIIAAHGNSLRALVKHLDGIPEDVITGLNIPTATPLVYELDADLKVVPHADAIAPLQGRYLGDQAAVRARIEGVANQTK
ncbi:histidine phosphatase superfamily [Tribonema minus]|uniref:phosphoglycerate mutase (2,3-diphosphoglycerate-dependent) n=1 Tax=Tribonema minus TaxID=303371 RepID=A0A836C7J0_9STRA|nr:histidine phosphatase superfamily [Tribonema minus]